ncbi:hypothetical protein SKAU_G00423130 [Synaphobranchus kaupii]|uniref:Glucosidase, alpha n=1 Tax=Synaphobranchus kaupii TaxID=118154 RepID=A0A9Q1E5D1_SYNKA|nr:hypothetical protein SKAU_G00423130 [Synaphobranchus kaupii]
MCSGTTWTTQTKRRVFTFDPQRFGDLPEMVKEFHRQGMKTQGSSSSSPPGSYRPFDEGLRRVRIHQECPRDSPLLGRCGRAPRRSQTSPIPRRGAWWRENIEDFHSKVPRRRPLWIDMNEPSSFVQGSVEGCPNTDLESPPLRSRCDRRSPELSYTVYVRPAEHLLSLQPAQPLWADRGQRHLQVRGDTASALAEGSSNPVPLFCPAPRSPGWVVSPPTGRETFRATGSSYAIPSLLCCCLGCTGYPLVGADVCGFGGDTTEELCVRWMQLGAFYPFMRNHNDRSNIPQEPYVFGQRAQAAMRGALTLRYSLLPLLYTLFHHAHSAASTVARPLFLEFPSDPNCQTVDRQFLWGSSLLISPVLEQGSVELAVYLPPGTWYSLPDGQPFHSRGQYLLLPAPLDTINVHLREGHIIPQQEPALTTAASRTNPFLLTVALSAEGWARGELFWDDGDSLDTFEMGDYSYLLFIAGEAMLVSQPLKTNGALDGLVLDEVRIFGVPSPPLDVWVNGERLRDFSYRSDTQVLTVPSLALPMAESFTMHWRL